MRFTKGVEDVLGPVLIALVFAGYPTAVRAQTTSASVSGSVQDAQGGVLPGVTVTMTSRTQGNVLTAVTDPGGRFVFPIVRPDAYTLKLTLEGFKTVERTNLIVNANDKLSTGALTLEVGALSEEVQVTGRVTELQTTSGERSFTLESAALTNIANNGRAVFNFVTLVPGALSQNTGNTELGSVSGFTVNGQRPNSNNITIDGVANIDTGDNGGNMVTTNIDAVAEVKVLTNAYQAEYGRAVGGQLQVVTKSGSQKFHGSGYWFGRRSDWDANSYLNKRETPEVPKSQTARNDSGYTFGGPVSFPGFNESKKKLFFFWSQEFERRTNPATVHQTRVPTALERKGDFSQSVDSSGNPFPYIRDYSHRTAVQRLRHARLFPGWRRPRPDSREPALCGRPVLPEHFPDGEFLGRQRPELHEPGSGQPQAPRRAAAHGLPAHGQLAGHRPLHEQQGRHPAGVWDDVGRQRQRPAPDADAVRAPRIELHAVRDRRPELHHHARAELGTRQQLAGLSTSAAAVVPFECERVVAAAAVPRRRPGRLRALVRLPRR